jgi:hypothetical protein
MDSNSLDTQVSRVIGPGKTLKQWKEPKNMVDMAVRDMDM